MRLPDRIWVPAALAGALALLFVGALLVRADGDVSLLVHAGPPWTSADDARDTLTVQEADQAFDGQFFYRLGTAPWSTAPVEHGVTFDLPSLRNARWGYGALAYVASGGDPDRVPEALVALNVLAAVAVGAAGGGLARSSGHHAAWGALFVLWPGFAYSLSLDTSELVASAFVLGGLLALRHRRWAPAAALMVAAVLTRDTTAVVPFGAAAAGAWAWWADRRSAEGPTGEALADRNVDAGKPDRPVASGASDAGAPTAGLAPSPSAPVAWMAVGAVPLVAFGAWQLLQRSRFGALPLTSSGDNNLSAPLGGLIDQLGSMLPPGGGDEAFRLLSILGLAALLGTAAWCWRRSDAPLPERVAWLPAVAVVVLLNAYLWSGATAFMRAATEAGLLSILVLLGSRKAGLLPLVATGLGGLWLLTAVAQLSKLV
ncbi:MAG: hypothetical protein KF703_06935 [Actinobacteria bacterium]|nr:hypothetical protein [Actinomycetota bacterium]